MRTKIMFMFFLLLLPALSMAESRYFGPDGREVSESEYRAISKTWNRGASQSSEEASYANYRRLMEAQHERQWVEVVDREGSVAEEKPTRSRVTTYTASRQEKAETRKTETKTETEIPVDVLGRPLKDEQGRWITYADDAKPSYRRGSGGNVIFAPVFFRRSIFGW